MKYLYIIIAFSLSLSCFAQDFNFKSEYNPSDKKMISNYLSFEGINFSQNSITSKDLVNKNYIINLKEYKNGALVNTTCLDKSNNEYYAIIDSSTFQFNILGKRTKSNYELCLYFNRYSTKKHTFKLQSKYAEDYILKEIPVKENDLQFNKPFIFLLLTTPEYHKDGSASWCDVAANETPEKIYEKNKIPHFFVFEMTIL
ncbi:hypothetical protein [Flavobacterium aquatile]|uniref:Carbohydrate-binding domain-containing protein n=1 Tax=Flavobacterium aquatile LMG 4008 = ATCC 11947 TaxID=1453498 RepID=A0A095SUQ0_9FLAO|nr:hypothetical protein [Flavobacterium aquatile]KGD68406.1 hypothetical protein LG45_08965 [Flavobacterium aquatile LMG 4008 = ATCC 11947]OXA68665.1 hypothetical protein B0A61_02855 [Flavobacterium aquatile LMG 4008 = ATCC 11947]GEC79291.1 hypothetical protein FAQ01_21610 [Flavobacterium aquatile]